MMTLKNEINDNSHNFAIAYENTNHFDFFIKVYGKENIPQIVKIMEKNGYTKVQQESWSYDYHIYGLGFNKKEE